MVMMMMMNVAERHIIKNSLLALLHGQEFNKR